MSSSNNPHFDSHPSVDMRPDLIGASTATHSEEQVGTGAPSPISPPLVPRDPVWTGWDVLLIAALTIVILIAVELLTIAGAAAFVYRHARFRDLVQNRELSVIGQFLGYIVVAFCMIMLVEGKYHVRFGEAIRWNWQGKAVPKLFGVGVLTVSLDILSRYLPMPKTTPFDQFFSNPRDALMIAAFAVTLGPLMEELFFRGLLYPVLARRLGIWLAVVFTALPFGLMHYPEYRSWAAVLVVTLVGVVLTVVRAVTNSVAASFLVHLGYNATLMFLAAVATGGFRHMERIALYLR